MRAKIMPRVEREVTLIMTESEAETLHDFVSNILPGDISTILGEDSDKASNTENILDTLGSVLWAVMKH